MLLLFFGFKKSGKLFLLFSKNPKFLNSSSFLFSDEMTDPAAQPVVWVSKWVDYSDKYGFGYQLCDDGCGVMFNDNSRIVLLANQRQVNCI